ncbi:hypothetical protein BU16DRAFT_455409 [Lophium mytilinum]|uniref:P-loop containing nucleoside triphosphate hydrolase protein n=1 Tax=Lophium mytilinum TaxID=390894 RepID=A0A6A6R5C2_9PEZI|nr:hypothetical protein BU16DRAFT_455409 [Lophium mytilinum]
MAPNSQPFIWINAFPGTGKLTITTHLLPLLSNNPESTPLLIHNHKLIDPVSKTHARDHPDYQTERKRVRDDAFATYVEDPSTLNKIVIFTDFQTQNSLGRAVANEYLDAARRAGRRFVPIYLTCDVTENVRRMVSEERVGGGMTKLVDARVLEEMRERCELFRFKDLAGVELDVTTLTPERAAELLAESIRKVVREGAKGVLGRFTEMFGGGGDHVVREDTGYFREDGFRKRRKVKLEQEEKHQIGYLRD